MSAPDVVIVPDRHGTGTNALLLAPPDAIHPSFGPGSRERHEQAAAANGARWRVAEPRSLVLDVDTAEDLVALRAALGARTGGAAHTRGLLARLDRR
jgi:2-phospho-L-lactate guanylyltransferase